jgi:hypothetical protein
LSARSNQRPGGAPAAGKRIQHVRHCRRIDGLAQGRRTAGVGTAERSGETADVQLVRWALVVCRYSLNYSPSNPRSHTELAKTKIKGFVNPGSPCECRVATRHHLRDIHFAPLGLGRRVAACPCGRSSLTASGWNKFFTRISPGLNLCQRSK